MIEGKGERAREREREKGKEITKAKNCDRKQ